VLEVEESSPSLPGLIMKFKGFDDPEAAKALGGAELIISREQASPLKPGEFYIEDLRGLPVISGEGSGGEEPAVLGHITDIVEGGGGDLAEIRLNTGESRFVPFRNEFFAPVNPESRRVILLAEWILE
jgi:16S rRNA processing protein RimM